MADVIRFTGITKLPIPVERILGDALAEGMDTAMVIGWNSKREFWFSSSCPDAGEILLLLAHAHKKLMEVVDDEDTKR